MTSQKHINIWFRSHSGKNVVIFDTDMNLQQFNQFRRIILSEIAVIAVDIVRINSNDTTMADEVLANRLGLIPVVVTNQDVIVRKDLCTCQNVCEKCSIMIEFKGKTFESKSPLLTNDISPLLAEDISLTIVEANQSLSFDMYCTKSIAQEHAKYSPNVVVSLLPTKSNNLQVQLVNSGTIDFVYILRHAFGILRSRLDIPIMFN